MIVDTIHDIIKVSKMNSAAYSQIYAQTCKYKPKVNHVKIKVNFEKEFTGKIEEDIEAELHEQRYTKKVIDNFVKYEQFDHVVKKFRINDPNPEIEKDLLKLYTKDASYHSLINQATQKIYKFHITIEFKKKNYRPTEDAESQSILEAKISEMILGRWILINVSNKKYMKEIVARSLMEVLYPRIYKLLNNANQKSDNIDDLLMNDNILAIDEEFADDRKYYDLSQMNIDSTASLKAQNIKQVEKIKNIDVNDLKSIKDNHRSNQLEAVDQKRQQQIDTFVYNSQIAKEEVRNFEEYYMDILPSFKEEFTQNFTITPFLLKYKNSDPDKKFFINMVIYDDNTYRNLRTKLFRYFYDKFNKSNMKLNAYPIEEDNKKYYRYEFKIDKKELLATCEISEAFADIVQYFKFMFLSRVLFVLNI